MQTARTKPDQATSGGLIISYYPDSASFSIGLREKIIDGVILPSKIIPLDPGRVAAGEDPEGFAEMMHRAADEILKISKQYGGNEDA